MQRQHSRPLTSRSLIASLSLVVFALSAAANAQDGAHGSSRLSDVSIPLAVEGFPARPRPLLELGSPFLGTGPIRDGFRIPGGAILQPSFLLFGTFRTSVSTLDDEAARTSRWANRLDLFGNVYFTQTERLVFGLRPLDQSNPQGGRSFSGYTSIESDNDKTSVSNNHFNLDSDSISHLFFEGDFGELFPNLDDNDTRSMDFGFAIGRQPINFQDGLLINDSIDALGITRNNLRAGRAVSYRITALVGWNEINRNTGTTADLTRNAEADSARLFGFFNEIDWRATTVSLDAIYVTGGTFRGVGLSGEPVEVEAGDGVYFGAGLVQRFGSLNTSFRLLASTPVGDDPPAPADPLIGDPVAQGALAFAEFSWTPKGNHNFAYATAFLAVDNYRAAALDPNVPGPLARMGILFAGSAVGDPGAISGEASEAAGLTFGHQWFFAGTRRQLLLETGVRYSTQDCLETTICAPDTIALGVRYQVALGRRGVLVVDGYVANDSIRDASSVPEDTSRSRVGGRVELITKF
ncbi:MAG: hypothetical protein PVF50_04370 [Gammaproteobacteria bacterium]|jgi:hypothetical protein